ncbi:MULTISPECIES: class I SAM-dependent methyltransferase [Saccharibacillus]|uniref:class I SAM-dependent methyltransferase n=1 Tax=Saccharibacillus TaxID=456492 RepID=UPI001F1A5BA1|nr:class I SAM-dependent methyltransferase [Saccharibacillus sp. WB 17]
MIPNDPDMQTRFDNDEEYADPQRYDRENEDWKPDLPLLLKLAGEAFGHSVLEIGCGTGRTAIPLAEAGYPVVGVDLHEGMLDLARSKAEVCGVAVDWRAGDIANLTLADPAGFVYMTGNGFQHFLTNEHQNSLLQAVKRNLIVGGTFVFDTRFPGPEELMQPETEQFWRSTTEPDGLRTDLYTIARYDALTQIQHYTTIRRQEAGSEQRSRIALRYTYPQELLRLVEQAGFAVEGLYSDWNLSPLAPDAYSMICVCRKK